MRVVICGVPGSGKTTLAWQLAELIGREPWSTDDLRREDNRWDLQAREAARWLAEPGPWIVEGMTALLALELADVEPDAVVWLGQARVPLSYGQGRLAAESAAVWERVHPRLRCRVFQGSASTIEWALSARND